LVFTPSLYRQTMACGMNAPLRRLKQCLGNRKRIRPARGLAAIVDQRGEGYRLPLPQTEYPTQKFSNELDGRVAIVVKDKLNRLGENVMHERPPYLCNHSLKEQRENSTERDGRQAHCVGP
jgi:hypothetical protein